MSFSYRKSRRYELELKGYIGDNVQKFPIFSAYRLVNLTDNAGNLSRKRIRQFVELIDQLLSIVFLYPIFLYEVIKLIRLFRELNPDVLHINNGGYPGARSARSAACAGKICGIRNILMTVNNVTVPYNRLSRIAEYPVDFFVRKSVTKFVTASEYASSSIRVVLNIPLDRAAIIENAVRAPEIVREYPYNREILGCNSEHVVICVTATLESRKGHEILLDALAKILFKKPYLRDVVKLWIIGDGPLWADLNETVQSFGLQDNVQFLGYRYDYLSLMSEIDIFVLTSVSSEDSPLSTIEAMSLGIPIIASNLAGLSNQIVHGLNGFLFPVGDVHKLAYYMERLVVDKSLRNSMGLSAKDQYTKRYSSEVFVLNYEKLYSNKL
jgi:glycosyltransferase involved in cell wall biosynthesis